MKIKFKRDKPSPEYNTFEQYSLDEDDAPSKMIMNHILYGHGTQILRRSDKEKIVECYDTLIKMHNCELYFYSDFKAIILSQETTDKHKMRQVLVFDDGHLECSTGFSYGWGFLGPQESFYNDIINDPNVKKALRSIKYKKYKENKT
jgi:ATP-dependent helicase YprA (DUF1998 family)